MSKVELRAALKAAEGCEDVLKIRSTEYKYRLVEKYNHAKIFQSPHGGGIVVAKSDHFLIIAHYSSRFHDSNGKPQGWDLTGELVE